MRLSSFACIILVSCIQSALVLAWKVQYRFNAFALSSKRPNKRDDSISATENNCYEFINGYVDRSKAISYRINQHDSDSYQLTQFIVWNDFDAPLDKYLEGFLFYTSDSSRFCHGRPAFYLELTLPNLDDSETVGRIKRAVQDVYITVPQEKPVAYYRAVYNTKKDKIYDKMRTNFPFDNTVRIYTDVENFALVPLQRFRQTLFIASKFQVTVETVLQSNIIEVEGPDGNLVESLVPAQNPENINTNTFMDIEQIGDRDQHPYMGENNGRHVMSNDHILQMLEGIIADVRGGGGGQHGKLEAQNSIVTEETNAYQLEKWSEAIFDTLGKMDVEEWKDDDAETMAKPQSQIVPDSRPGQEHESEIDNWLRRAERTIAFSDFIKGFEYAMTLNAQNIDGELEKMQNELEQ